MTELMFPPRNSANAPKNVAWYAAYILRMSRKYLTLRLLMSYIYIYIYMTIEA